MKWSFWQFRIPLLIALLTASMSAQNGGLRFTITDLGPTGLGLFSIAHGINNRGDVVGTVAVPGGGQECFLLPHGGQMIYFAGDTKVPYCDAVAINSQGVIAGTITYQKSPGPLAFRRAVNGVITTLQSPYGSGYDQASAINAKNVVVGVSAIGFPTEWDSSGKVTYVSTTYGNAAGMNDQGEIVGWDDSVWGNQCCNAWTSKNGVLTYLQTLGDRYGGWAWAINNRGFVAGAGIPEPFWYPSYPFEEVFWNTEAPGSPISDFGYTLGFMQSAVAISSDNWLVGGYREWPVVYVNIQVPYPSDAFLVVTDPAGCPLTPLMNLLDSSGSVWANLVVANGINDSHQIVGYGSKNNDPYGQVHAFLLTPNNLPLCYPD
jgi:hypothetical protein